ncbi:MAG TPA: Mu transposase C-terminal domain-containing protein [Mycobacteriales bacterium]|nr:Mu transposase C-terminal domain-containing protein [Mycobacteriales bacterium]
MASLASTLRTGATVRFDGDTHQVVALDGTCATLHGRSGHRQVIRTSMLLSDPSFAAGDGATAVGASSVGALMTNVEPAILAEARERAAHLEEVLNGLPRPDNPNATVPRPQYEPDRPKRDRVLAKAQELGVNEKTLRRWLVAYRDRGIEGLVDHRRTRQGTRGADIDPKWVDAVRDVIDDHIDLSRPTKKRILHLAARRVDDTVTIPKRTVAHEALRRIEKGTNAFAGATIHKRSIANRPKGAYRQFAANRPGEYLLLDTTKLDVFAMDRLTSRWVPLDLTVAMDLYSRSILGLALCPISTKSRDVAGVLFEAIHPRPRPDDPMADRPYAGLPSTVMYPDPRGESISPPAIEAMVVDHGKIYVSDHIKSVCARLGISIQPCRPYTPTDKGPCERFFKTLRQGLLETLPGYKGPDVYSRGRDVENASYYFIDQLDAIIRGWIEDVYHQKPVRGLIVPESPRVNLSPIEMFEQGVTAAGYLRILPDADFAFDFLPTAWRKINHYGVELNGLKYNGEAINEYRDQDSAHAGLHHGKWPFRWDPNDIRQIYFQDPSSGTWHRLDWVHRHRLNAPFSVDRSDFAKAVAFRTDRAHEEVCQELLDFWLTRDTVGRPELRLSLQQAVYFRSLGLGETDEHESADRDVVVDEDDPILNDPDLAADDHDLDAADVYDDVLEILS